MTNSNLKFEPKCSDLIQLLRQQSELFPDKTAYIFLEDGEDQERRWTYAELERRARTIGAHLQQQGLQGQRAILLYLPDLDYIASFLGCLYAGVVAVPIYPLDPNRLERTLPRFQAILNDSGAKVILSTETIQSMAQFLLSQVPDLNDFQWMATDQLDLAGAKAWKNPQITPEHLAFLQYTSGSTGDPKGVMLTHNNLMYNFEVIRHAFELKDENIGVSWLPPYHDMGLIGALLETLYVGGTTTFMSPLHFLQKPFRWLQAISKYQAGVSGGPNFAYELCVQKTTPEQRAQLDLSHWQLAFNGAEPIQTQTMDRFVEAFAPCGFKREAFYPCYGLAEATLLVAGSRKNEPPLAKKLSKADFHKKQISQSNSDSEEISLVSCGTTFAGQKIVVVRPDTHQLCPDGEIGEIWVSGPSIAQGYWNKAEATQAAFGAQLKGAALGSEANLEPGSDIDGKFLRTGDLGFLEKGELFVTGRLKELIIVRGENHYPHDIERSAEKAHSAIRSGCSAAFSVKVGLEEKLAIVLELDEKNFDKSQEEYEGLFAAVRKLISQEHELETYAIALVKKGEVPKTSSGKIRRVACHDDFVAGTLKTIQESRHELPVPAVNVAPKAAATLDWDPKQDSPNQSQLVTWLQQNLSEYLGLEPQQVDSQKLFSEYGLDSKDAVNLSGELEDLLGVTLSPTLLWKYPSIQTLAEYLVPDA